MKKIVKIQFRNGLNRSIAENEILNELTEEFIFEESSAPDFILFGPYGNDIPASGNYIRIGYFCENIKPDLSICEWAFGIPTETEINHPNYKRIQWHGLDPRNLLKNLSDNDIDILVSSKTKFCNFLYSNEVPYREAFFRELSKYKKIDAPGRSMKNMESIDRLYTGNVWERKRRFLSQYKFTIAFENYSYPGYQTEKLYDPMLCNSIPIYCGDPFVGEIFNTSSFINSPQYIKTKYNKCTTWLEARCQPDFKDYRPQFYSSPTNRTIRKLKAIGRDIKMRLQYNKTDFYPLIDRIIEIDNDKDQYVQYLKQPWFTENRIPDQLSTKNRWIEIFEKNNEAFSFHHHTCL